MTTLNMTYGSGDTPCTVFNINGWYVVEGSVNVNFTNEELIEGESVEYLQDVDCFTTTEPIESIKELLQHVVEHDEYLNESI